MSIKRDQDMKQIIRSNELLETANLGNPYSSFERFVAFMKDKEHSFSLSSKDLSSYLSSFMLDPYRHRKFVEVIFETAVHSELKRSVNTVLRGFFKKVFLARGFDKDLN